MFDTYLNDCCTETELVFQLEDEHSIEVQTPATRSPSICFALCDTATLTFDLSTPKVYHF